MKNNWSFLSFFLTIFVLISFFESPVKANGIRTISSPVAQGLSGDIPTIAVSKGAGVNLSFPDDEIIYRAWLDDASKIVIDFDVPLGSGNASFVHLKRINPLKFANIPATSSTLLTILTRSEKGKKRYQFKVTYNNGTPFYSGVTIEPSILKTDNNLWGEQVSRGLEQVKRRGLISVEQGNQDLERKIQFFLMQVTQGIPLKEAASQAKVSLPLVYKLAELGQSSSGLMRGEVFRELPSINTPSFGELQPINLEIINVDFLLDPGENKTQINLDFVVPKSEE